MKSTPTDTLESKLSIFPINISLEELHWLESVKLLIKEDDNIQSSMIGRNESHKWGSRFENLRSLTKQILQFLSQTKKCNVNQSLLTEETLATLEIFHIPNLLINLPEAKLQLSVPLTNTDNMQHFISSVLDTGTNKTMIVLQSRNSTAIKIAKTVKCMGSTISFIIFWDFSMFY